MKKKEKSFQESLEKPKLVTVDKKEVPPPSDKKFLYKGVIEKIYKDFIEEIEILFRTYLDRHHSSESDPFLEFIGTYFYKREVLFKDLSDRSKKEKDLITNFINFISEDNLFFSGMMEVNEWGFSPAVSHYFQEKIYFLTFIRIGTLEHHL